MVAGTITKKQRILESRQKGAELLIGQIKRRSQPPQKVISSSAVGIYGHCGEEEIDIHGPLGDDFLARVCKTWEESILNHGGFGYEGPLY